MGRTPDRAKQILARNFPYDKRIGVSMALESGRDAEERLRRADAAMYAAKKLGKNCVHCYRVAVPGNATSLH